MVASPGRAARAQDRAIASTRLIQPAYTRGQPVVLVLGAVPRQDELDLLRALLPDMFYYF